jgi:hypothetical protein
MANLIIILTVIASLAFLLLIGEFILGMIGKIHNWKTERAYMKPQTRYYMM